MPPFDIGPPPMVFPKPAIIRPATEDLIRHGGDPVARALTAHGLRRVSGAVTIAKSAVYQGETGDASNLTTYTFNTQPFGTAQADRYICVAYGARQSGGAGFSSGTIGGVSASKVVESNLANWWPAGMMVAAVPTGTTGTVAITFGGTMTECAIAIWAMYGLSSGTPYDTAHTGNQDPQSLNVDTQADGFVIAYGHAQAETFSSMTGVTQDFYNTAQPEAGKKQWGGHANNVSAATPRTVSFDLSAQSNQNRACCVSY